MSQYTAEAIEVLTGLDPVRKRPGMYTDTTRPNHLAQEVIDNSVDEALAGHARQIDVILHKDGSQGPGPVSVLGTTHVSQECIHRIIIDKDGGSSPELRTHICDGGFLRN